MTESRIEKVTSVLLAIAAVVMAGVLLHREFLAPAQSSSAGVTHAPELVPDWQSLVEVGTTVGDRKAPIHIIEFMDLECPFCRRFHVTERSIRRRFGDAVAVTFVHFPLPMHRFARPAAIAAECARAQNRFDAFVGAVYAKQDSLGLKSWASFASETGVANKAAFQRCTETHTMPQNVERGTAAARRLGLNGTPTVIVNGWRYYAPPDEAELERVISALLAAKAPFPE